jgi:putative NIF3 family GTP cyclohydrolase 1 type 2
MSSPLGVGRLGRLPQPMSLQDFSATVKNRLKAGPVQVVGDRNRPIHNIAIVCGAGGSLLRDAVHAGADVLLTGEMRFHDYLTAEAEGIALVLPGHYATERCGVEALAQRLHEHWPALKVWPSQREYDPLHWVG